jgi:hypothetical protein
MAKSIITLNAELRQAEAEYKEICTPHLSQDDIECVSDRYQEALEANWAKDEVRERIAQLKKDIVLLTAVHVNHPKRPRLDMIRDMKIQTHINNSLSKWHSLSQTERDNIVTYNSLPRIFPHELNTGCTICGDYEGDAQDCPNGCHDNNEPSMQDWSDFADACEEHDNNII